MNVFELPIEPYKGVQGIREVTKLHVNKPHHQIKQSKFFARCICDALEVSTAANAGASHSGTGVPDVEPYEDQLPSFDTEYQKVYLGKDTAIFSCKKLIEKLLT